MIYAIIDTNVWIYLSNGHGLDTEKSEKNPHVRMLTELKNRVLSKQVTILSNDIIMEEWKRNEKHTRKLIEQLRQHKTEASNRLKNKIKKNPNTSVADIYAEIQNIDQQIVLNEKHIKNVEDLLMNHTVKYPITDNSYILGAKQAIKKMAPFQGKKSNSMADFIILLSGTEYIKNHACIELTEDLKIYSMNYFISGNTTDFASPTDKDVIHDDLSTFIIETETKFCNNLGSFLNELSGTLIFDDDDLEDYNNYILNNDIFVPCSVCRDEDLGYVDFNNHIEIRDERYPLYDRNQLRLEFDTRTPEEMNSKSYIETEEGYCGNCSSHFIRCAICGEPIYVDLYSEDDYECDSCSAVYQVKVKLDRKGDIETINYLLLKESISEDDN